MIFRRAWKFSRWCTRQTFRLSLWSTWLVLLAALAGQIHLLSARRVPVPQPLLRVIEERLAARGVRIEFGRSVMNFSGRFILEDVRVGATTIAEPLATARSVYLQVEPWDLLVGQLTVNEIRVGGLDLHLPPAQSASGADELPAGNLDFLLRPAGKELEVSYLTGYIVGVPVQASGRIRLPGLQAGARPEITMERVTATYLLIARQAQAAGVRVAAFEAPHLEFQLRLDEIAVNFGASGLNLGAFSASVATGRATGVQLKTRVSLDDLLTAPAEIDGAISSLELPAEIGVREINFRVRGHAGGAVGVEVDSLELQLGALRWRGIEAGPLAVSAHQPSAGLINADLSVELAGSAWRVYGQAMPGAGTARVSLDGFLGDATLAFAGERLGRDLARLLDPAHPAPLHATASFGPGWKLSTAAGRLHSGPVLVGGAQLDETGTEFTYDGDRVLCDNLVLRQGESLAHGSYEMDAHTMDFRFLLTGGLQPMGINKWFHPWWTEFWRTFDFSRGLPVANVDVRGRWGDQTATRVFVQAEGDNIGLKGVAFDRVRTRLFLRPQWFDILNFYVLRSGQEAQGVLVRSLDLAKETWSHMEFSVDSTLPLETISTLFKEESAELLAPYHFNNPPHLLLSGRVDSAASPAGKKEAIDITLTSTGALTYHKFPLADLSFEANLRDDVIELPVLAVSFAEGKANGKARLRGPEGARHLSFDIALADANLGAVIQAVSLLQPPATPATEKATEKATEATRQRQERLDRGRLVFTLIAEGLYADFYSFKGVGRAAITGAELAQLNLFGPLSEALRGTYFNLGSFSLTTVDAPFVLNGADLSFEDLRVTGPSALLQATGSYELRAGALDFKAKIHPFEESSSLVGSAMGFVLSPLSKVFEVKLQGTLSKPSWIFAYGPSRLLNSLTGGEKSTEPAASE